MKPSNIMVYAIITGVLFWIGCPFLFTMAVFVTLGFNKLIKWDNKQ